MQANPAPFVSDTCVDDNVNCPTWAIQGYCTIRDYVDYMKHGCKKSCNFCGAGKKYTRFRI